MNHTLPLFALLSLAGLLARRRGLGLAWATSGVAAMLLLQGAWSIPDGIASPSATLTRLAPWQGAATGTDRAPAEPGNPLLRDVTFQIEPWLLAERGEWRAGRLPLWNPWQFAGAPFWANGQSAPLFPLHLLFAAVPLQVGFLLLPWLRLTIAGCGAWALSRRLGVGETPALLAAVLFPLSGMLASFALYPMGNALALVPWVLWAIEGLACGVSSWRSLAALAALQMLGGHPETVLHTGLLALVYLTVRRAPLGAWLRSAGACGVAAAIAAVQWLPLAFLVRTSSRWAAAAAPAGATPEPPLGVFLEQPLRLLLPHLFGHPAAADWWGPFNYSATAVYAGVLALPLAVAGLGRLRGDRRTRAIAACALVAALGAYHVPLVRQALAAVPLLGRALQHRLIFGIELGVAVLAAAGLEAFLAGHRRGLAVGAFLAAGGVALAWCLFAAPWREHGLTGSAALQSAAVAGAAFALLAATFVRGERGMAFRTRLVPLLIAGAAIELAAAHGAINPGLSLARLYPATPAIEFLRRQEGRMAAVGEAFRPNAAMAYGLYDLRGDDPLKSSAFEAAYADVAMPNATYFEPIRRWDASQLDAWSVRFVLAGPREAPERADWDERYRGEDARVFERPSALPLVRWRDGAATDGLRVLARAPGLWRVAWSAARARTLVVGESPAAGWHAESAAGAALDVQALPPGVLAVAVGPGAGEVVLRYRPPGLVAGAWLGVAGCALLAGSAWRERRVA